MVFFLGPITLWWAVTTLCQAILRYATLVPPVASAFVAEHPDFVVPSLASGVDVGGSACLESLQTDAFQIPGTHYHSNAILPQGTVRLVPTLS